MSKIVQAVNAMIANHHKISNVKKNDEEIFFLYDSKYKWSIRKERQKGYTIFYYPLDNSLEDLASYGEGSNRWDEIEYLSFKTTELKTQEAFETFSELYTIVSGKIYGFNQVLDDIINTEEE